MVLTRRGIHVHFNANRLVGKLSLFNEEGEGREGGNRRSKNLWAVPSTVRHGFTYHFFNNTDTVPELISVSLDEFEADIGIVFPVEIRESQTVNVSENITLSNVEPIPGINELSEREPASPTTSP